MAVGVAFAAPFAFLLIRTLQAGYLEAVAGARLLVPLGNTLVLATAVATASATIGTAAAWLVARTDVPAGRLWRLVLPLPLVVPSFIGAFALIAAFAPGGVAAQVVPALADALPEVRGMPGAILVLSLLSYPYVYLPVAARLDELSPSLEEAARLHGRRSGEVFVQIVLPQLRDAVLAGTLLAFLYAVSDFGAVTLLRVETLTRAMYVAYQAADAPTALALSLNLGVLALAVVVLERAATRRRTVVARSLRGLAVPLGRWRWPALALLAAVVGVGLAAPMVVLTYWAVRGVVGGTTRAGALVADLGDLVAPMLRTAEVSLLAAAAAVVVLLPLAYLLVRFRSPLAEVANALVVGGFALPGLAIALALAFWTLRGPLRPAYQTTGLLVFAYVVHFGAQSLRAAEVAVRGVPQRLDDAARVLGAGRWRRLATVDLPLMVPGLVAGGGLVMLSAMKELPATLLLAPPGFQTLATRVWQATQDAYLADASLAALLLVALSGALTWSLVLRRR